MPTWLPYYKKSSAPEIEKLMTAADPTANAIEAPVSKLTPEKTTPLVEEGASYIKTMLKEPGLTADRAEKLAGVGEAAKPGPHKSKYFDELDPNNPYSLGIERPVWERDAQGNKRIVGWTKVRDDEWRKP